MGKPARKPYGWYKHHAWAALAMLSLFFAITRFVSVHDTFAIAIVLVLAAYAGTAIIFTYLRNVDNTDKGNDSPSPQGDAESRTDSALKTREKIEKKRQKAMEKSLKKTKSS
ncbi:MAG: hypothetical protein PHW58_00570 [Candidatus Methanofastidiosa archaeon]|nr:hypothetical protein [Candidatus Methanofastidiosa archaeon]